MKINDNFDLNKLETDFKFKNDEGFYKSPNNSIWINSKTKKVEDMSIWFQSGLYEIWIKKSEECNIIYYDIA